MEARYEIARKIVEKVAELEAGKLKKTARDYISGMIAAYGMLIGETNADRAYAQAQEDAQRPERGDSNDPQFILVN